MLPTGAAWRRTNVFGSPGGCHSSSGNFWDGSLMNQDFVDLLRAFSEADVRFLVVGAYALAHHGRPRATGGERAVLRHRRTRSNSNALFQVASQFNLLEMTGPGVSLDVRIVSYGAPDRDTVQLVEHFR